MSRKHSAPRIVASISLAVAALAAVPVSAHEVPIEQLVRMTLEPRGSELIVRAHVPATALADVRMPRLMSGALDAATMDQLLQVVAADTARNLDIRQDDASLGAPRMRALLGADRASSDVELTYTLRGGSTGLSARLNAFHSTPLQPVRTTATFEPPAAAPQTVSVIGPPIRVDFDPSVLDVLQRFTARTLSTILTFGDHILMLVCLLLPIRTVRTALRLVAAMLAGQLVAIGLCLLAADSVPAMAPWATFIGASIVIMAAVQNIVQARVSRVGLLAALFGLTNGITFGSDAITSLALAGSHQAIALAAVLAVIVVGQLWLGGVAWATRAWLDGRGVSDRVVTVAVSALLAHTGVHAAIDRSQVFDEVGSFGANRALLWLTLGWSMLLLAAAVVEAIRGRTPVDKEGRESGALYA